MTRTGATRRKSQKKKKSFPWKKLAISFGTVSVLLVIGYVAKNIHGWLPKVTEIEIDGPFVYVDKQDILNEVKKSFPASYFEISLGEIQKNVESLSMVSRTEVIKRWPDKLYLHFYEELPVANWNHNGFVSASGILLEHEINKELAGPMPVFFGPKDMVGEQMVVFKRLSSMLSPYELKIHELHVSSRHSWKVVLNTGLNIHLGQQDPLSKMRSAVSLIKRMPAQLEKVSYLDARYSNGLAIGWKQNEKLL